MRTPLIEWTLDYGDGRETLAVILPHAWRQDVPVGWEGPATYSTTLEVPAGASHLHFSGVSYEAQVFVEGERVAEHRGIWDAFDIPLDRWAGRTVGIQVRVVKNGGNTYPVKEVASGFLPFVYHTFGGIYGEVELVTGPPQVPPPAPPSRVSVDGHRIYVDGKPFLMRGLLTWGWYPEVGHPNPPDDVVRREVRAAKELGFNLVKFCLYVPRHRTLEILREEGMEAWVELPLWDPTDDPARQTQIAEELERIVRQYRRHDNIIVWTVGCELSGSTSPEYRQRLTQLVRNLTGCPLVKDNSGGAEMYGGDLREFGTFYDFHPYCDTPFYPQVLDSLLPGARPSMPILLGEFNDIDAHRDLGRLGSEYPYWASSLPELNDVGVRWQHDLPGVLADNRFALHPVREGSDALIESSRQKALFIRKFVQEAVREREQLSGYVITGWRDTPISTAGFFDDWDKPRYFPSEVLPWNGDQTLFLIPVRRPPWVTGGNRPGYLDPHNFFCGTQAFWRVGLSTEGEADGGLVWRVRKESGEVVAAGAEPIANVPALSAREVAQISWRTEEPGDYVLEVEFGGCSNRWPIWVVPALAKDEFAGWRFDDARGVFAGLSGDGDGVVSSRWPDALPEGRAIYVVEGEGCVPMPFWRESAYQFAHDPLWDRLPVRERWSRLLPIGGDCVLDIDRLRKLGEPQVLMNRIDTRTYAEHPVVARVGGSLFTTLRPHGGLGTQPTSLARNPAGVALLRALVLE
jgi:hypothetical protein